MLRLIEQKKYAELLKFAESFGMSIMLSLKECSTMGDDIKAIEEWSKIFTNKLIKNKVNDDLYVEYVKNTIQIDNLINRIK